MEMADRSDSDEKKLTEEPETAEEERDNEREEEEEEEKVKDGPNSTCGSLSNARPETMPTSASNAAVLAGAQLTIFYGGNVKVFDGIPEEKVLEIMRIAAAAAAAVAAESADVKNVETDNVSSTPPQGKSLALQNTMAAVGSLLAQLCPTQKSTLCKMQDEFPIARRHSLQRFLEKRRDRLVNKNPYPSSPAMKVENDTKS